MNLLKTTIICTLLAVGVRAAHQAECCGPSGGSRSTSLTDESIRTVSSTSSYETANTSECNRITPAHQSQPHWFINNQKAVKESIDEATESFWSAACNLFTMCCCKRRDKDIHCEEMKVSRHTGLSGETWSIRTLDILHSIIPEYDLLFKQRATMQGGCIYVNFNNVNNMEKVLSFYDPMSGVFKINFVDNDIDLKQLREQALPKILLNAFGGNTRYRVVSSSHIGDNIQYNLVGNDNREWIVTLSVNQLTCNPVTDLI